MNYAELSVAQNQRAKEFSKAQTDAMVAYCNAEHDLRELQAENAKLRELVRDLARWYGAEHQPHEELRFWGDKSSGVYARMRELGVEVDE